MILDKIQNPSDLKILSHDELKILANEIREIIIAQTTKNGGHLASNLGMVELTIALHRSFDSPKDAIIFDVSHQCYAHKLLTARKKLFHTLRQKGGISGFTNRDESEHDYFTLGHASTSISMGAGLLEAFNKKATPHEKERFVVAVIGDGSLTGGMALEALCSVGYMKENLIIVVNDNKMSISKNTGALSSALSRLSTIRSYQNLSRSLERNLVRIPFAGRFIYKLYFRTKRALKGLLLTDNLFVDLGFSYVGPLNGHDTKLLEKTLIKVKNMHRPTVVHVVTKKGKGLKEAEKCPQKYHGVSAFSPTENTKKFTFTDAFSEIILKKMEERKEIVCISASMISGTGLEAASERYKNRVYDVGIAEEHAVSFASGLSRGGLLPVVCIYSTFIQRSFDQVLHDVAIQKLRVVFVLDHAGAVAGDGETHQGLFDITLFRAVPFSIILSPATKTDFELLFEYALSPACKDCAVFIRYPKAALPKEIAEFTQKIEMGKGILLKTQKTDCKNAEQKKILFVATGGMLTEVLAASRELETQNINADVYSLRFIKPFDERAFLEIAKNYDLIIAVEDATRSGGISEEIQRIGLLSGIKVIAKAFEEKFYKHGTREEILRDAALDVDSLKKVALENL